jgi:uncharacterized protein DUF7033
MSSCHVSSAHPAAEQRVKTLPPTRGARSYALKELARRAGVTAEFIRSWRVDVRDDGTYIYVEPGTENHIRFPNAPPTFWRELTARRFHTTRASWMFPPSEPVKRLVPDFIIPFSHETRVGTYPLFSPVGRSGVECSLDLLASALLSLSRFEELASSERDVHGRVPASSSIAVRDGYLNRPIVDEYGLALEQAITYLLPRWRPVERKLRVKLSHDIDWTGVPVNLGDTVRQVGLRLRHAGPFGFTRDLLSWGTSLEPTFLKLVREIVQMSRDRGLDSAVYWMAAQPSRRDSGYDLRHPKIEKVIAWLRDCRVEMGVHPGYHSFLSPEQLWQEVQTVREVLGEQRLGGRQHYLRWSPETWLHWEMCGLAYDSTVGYADRIGFRAGTCIPYRPWLLNLDREANLVEIPLLVMEGALLSNIQLTRQQSLDATLELVARCRVVGGVFALLWHNGWLVNPGHRGLYRELLDTLVGHEKYDWRAPLNHL